MSGRDPAPDGCAGAGVRWIRRVDQRVGAGDPLGDADRLVAALDLDGDVDGDLDPAGDLLDVGSVAASRTFEPTGTGAGKRTLFRP